MFSVEYIRSLIHQQSNLTLQIMSEFIDDLDLDAPYTPPESKDNIVANTSAFESAPDIEIEERRAAARQALSAMSTIVQQEQPEAIATDKPQFKTTKSNNKKGPTKPQLVKDVIALQDQLEHIEKRPKSHYERMTKKELEEVLAYLSNEAANVLQNALPEDAPQISNKTAVSEELDGAKASRIASHHASRTKQIEYGAKALFQFNMILCKVAELGSVNFREKLGTDLEGLTTDVLQNREQLEEILSQIYEEHSETLKEYISPLNQYFLLMTSLGANRALANKAKVEEQLKKKI